MHSEVAIHKGFFSAFVGFSLSASHYSDKPLEYSLRATHQSAIFLKAYISRQIHAALVRSEAIGVQVQKT